MDITRRQLERVQAIASAYGVYTAAAKCIYLVLKAKELGQWFSARSHFAPPPPGAVGNV